MTPVSTNKNKIRLNWCTHLDNFGDELSPYLIHKITGKEVVFSGTKSGCLYAIGSILDYDAIHNPNIIWGSGSLTSKSLQLLPKIFPIKRNFPPAFKRIFRNSESKADIHAVRGELTREAIISQKIKCPEIYGDPAIICRNYFLPEFSKRYKCGLILHYSQSEHINISDPKIHNISIKRKSHLDIENFISEICQCEKIFTTSLHGLIIANTYGIPAQWIQLAHHPIHKEQSFKFFDYFSGVKAPLQKPLVLPIKDIKNLPNVILKNFIIKDSIIDKLAKSFPSDLFS